MEATYSHSGSGGFGKFLLVVVVLVLVVAGTAAMSQGSSMIAPEPGSEATWTMFEEVNLGALAVVVDPSYSHADIKHPTEAPVVRNCFDKNGAYQTFNVSQNRWLRVCITERGQFGFQIVDLVGREYKELTAYIRQDLKCRGDLVEYVKRVGYSRFKGVIR
jgi:hypothetical protein